MIGSRSWAQKSSSAKSLQAGLQGEYFDGPNFERKVLTRTDPQVNFNWNWASPGPGVPREYFSVRWTGKLYAPTSGKYRFSATVDDGVRVWVGGWKVIDEWRKQDDSRFVGEISLTGKQLYDLRIEYYNDWKGSVISVFWQSPEDQRLFSFNAPPNQVIPAKYLFSKPVVAPPTPVRREPVHPRALLVTTGLRVAKTISAKTPDTKPLAFRTVSIAKATPPPKPISAVVTPDTPAVVPANTAGRSFTSFSVGKPVTFQQVGFAQGEYTLLPESYAELDRLVQALQANPALQIEIAGHTDNVGDKRLNQTLSEYRAKVVAHYISQHGVAETRITAKGYGGSRPVTDNTSEKLRAQNRRVEFTVSE
ncbi:PA14 domain-containing protein [Spirosoma koreense]